jgi:hypothetical protein
VDRLAGYGRYCKDEWSRDQRQVCLVIRGRGASSVESLASGSRVGKRLMSNPRGTVARGARSTLFTMEWAE